MEAESHTTPTTVGKAGRAWCPDQYPDFKHPLKNFIMIAFTRPSVALTGYTNELMLHCPKCGDGKNDSYLHLQDFNKNGEDVSFGRGECRYTYLSREATRDELA